MDVYFLPAAEDVLYEIGVWVEQHNTAGSGARFINNFIEKIDAFALPDVQYQKCKNKILASYHLQCLTIDKWVIAFKQKMKPLRFILSYTGQV